MPCRISDVQGLIITWHGTVAPYHHRRARHGSSPQRCSSPRSHYHYQHRQLARDVASHPGGQASLLCSPGGPNRRSYARALFLSLPDLERPTHSTTVVIAIGRHYSCSPVLTTRTVSPRRGPVYLSFCHTRTADDVCLLTPTPSIVPYPSFFAEV